MLAALWQPPAPHQPPSCTQLCSPHPPLPPTQLHNLAHVELNAIDLAWDTVARYSALGLPEAFYSDFAR